MLATVLAGRECDYMLRRLMFYAGVMPRQAPECMTRKEGEIIVDAILDDPAIEGLNGGIGASLRVLRVR